MKKCIVCGKEHDRPDIFCEQHELLEDAEKLAYYKNLNYLIDNKELVMNKEDYSFVLMVPREDTSARGMFLINGKKTLVKAPIYIKITEDFDVDCRIVF